MPRTPSDRDAAELVQRSAAFRAVRAALVALDAAVASSAAKPALLHAWPPRAPGVVLIVAGFVHAMLVSALPAAAAPAGRYLFAIAVTLAGALLLVRARATPTTERPADVRHLR